MNSKKGKQWREAFAKSRTLSQTSLESSPSPTQSWHRKSSILDEQTTDKDLQDYLEGLKMKSGIKSLWHGNTFSKKTVQTEDRTPDISISSVESDEQGVDKSDDNDEDDYKPNVMAFSSNDDESNSSVSPLKGIQLDIGGFSDKDSDRDAVLNNVQIEKSMSDKKSIRSISNNLNAPEPEIDTEDEVSEDISEDFDENSVKSIPKTDSNRSVHGSEHSRHKSKASHMSNTSGNFSSVSSISSSTSRSKNTSGKHKSSKDSKSSRSSKLKEGSSEHYSKQSSTSSHHSRKRNKNDKRNNRITHEMSVQTEPITCLPAGIGVGMAATGPQYGAHFLDPSPIATHVVSPDSIEAMTAYNPAVIALTDMLRQQLRLVEQFVNNSQRIYKSYSESLNTSHSYTTLQETLQYIEDHRPPPLTMEQALLQQQDKT